LHWVKVTVDDKRPSVFDIEPVMIQHDKPWLKWSRERSTTYISQMADYFCHFFWTLWAQRTLKDLLGDITGQVPWIAYRHLNVTLAVA
jgi:hypothetical protein